MDEKEEWECLDSEKMTIKEPPEYTGTMDLVAEMQKLKQVFHLDDLVAKLEQEVSELKALDERYKNWKLRAHIPFHFRPAHSIPQEKEEGLEGIKLAIQK